MWHCQPGSVPQGWEQQRDAPDGASHGLQRARDVLCAWCSRNSSWSCAVTFPFCGIRGCSRELSVPPVTCSEQLQRRRTAICDFRLMALLFYLIRCLLQLLLGWVMDFQPQQLTREREAKRSQPHVYSLSLTTLCHSVFIEPWIKCFISKPSHWAKATPAVDQRHSGPFFKGQNCCV